ncbi:Inosine/uridine-preferring nucleoside hydrolase [Oceaniovalibus guishaninsula JLT2003]|uniref:Inosine/uridine-preferring nucleoside hydrolase n=1 Tax=Oceaniovalibus guishaninsula JLT2003 TaxID=1231392 RepID=K2GPJ8_9RHOB|nr:nucleoside hydrolase [Oceaniovalibus guishaninsula]EKE44581.1 Inosine/uridine-preferring nucleoside hydrolase [Oceaniovalibus guishaninsula JLT2003]
MTQRLKMVIDTDPGVDDAMAVFFAARTPQIDLLALTTVFGNVTVETATRNALHLCEMAGLDIPVAQGAAGPLARAPSPPSAHVHGAEGFGDLPAVAPARRAVAEDAADLLCRLAREHPGALTVCAIGPITNVAEAIRRDPAFARNVARIVFMGGAAWVPGNVTPHAEANTWNDPHALTEVLASGAPVVMVGLDVTMRVLCTAQDFARIARTDPHLGGFLDRASRFYLDFYRNVAGVEGCGLHDPAAIVAALRPDLFRMRRTALSVALDGAEIGRTRPVDDGPPIDICEDGDMEAVKALFLAAFDRPD